MAVLSVPKNTMLYEPDPPPNKPASNGTELTIYVFTFSLVVLTIVVAALLLKDARSEHLEIAQTEVRTTTIIYQENAQLVMSNVDSLLSSMAEHITKADPTKPEELHTFLYDLADGVPTLRTLLFINADGEVIADSRANQAAMGMDVRARDYFTVHGVASGLLESPASYLTGNGIYIGVPVQSMVDNAWSMPFSSAVYGANGDLAYVVVASIEPRYFHDIFSDIHVNDGQYGYLLRDDGTILSTLPYDESKIGVSAADTSLFRDSLFDNTMGNYQGTMLSDERLLISYQHMGNWPLILAFMLDEHVALDAFYDDVFRVSGISLIIVLSIISVGFVQLRQVRAITHQSTMLQNTNTTLRQEINERKRAEHTLNFTNRQLNLLLDHLPVLVYTTSKPGEFTPKYIGGSLMATIGYDEETLRSDINFWRDNLHPDDRETALGVLDTTLRFAKSHNQQYRWRCADGSYIWIMDYMRLVNDPQTNNYYVVGVWVDITEQRRGLEAVRTTEVLKVEVEKERELHTLRSRFLSMLTHQFRNPIAGLSMSISSLERYFDRLTVEQREDKFQILYQLLDQLNVLVEDVLITGRLENDQLNVELQRVDFCAYCSNMMGDFRLAAGSEHTVIYDGLEKCLPTLFDTKLMRHALMNLLNNAAKYSKPGTTITFKLRQAAQGSTIVIKDEGIGIPPQDINRLFELFVRAENAEGYPGTGIGLALTKHIIHLHHGTIQVESQLGAGTTFTIHLPVT